MQLSFRSNCNKHCRGGHLVRTCTVLPCARQLSQPRTLRGLVTSTYHCTHKSHHALSLAKATPSVMTTGCCLGANRPLAVRTWPTRIVGPGSLAPRASARASAVWPPCAASRGRRATVLRAAPCTSDRDTVLLAPGWLAGWLLRQS
jgi:hypothetical protein